MTRVSVNGIALNVEEWGAGEPLLLLHGFTGDATTWRFLHSIPYRCIAVDLPGHGRSDSPADPLRYRMERTVDDLLTVLDTLQLQQVHLLGYSMGGRVALRLALAAPQRVQSLVLESASPGIEDPGERVARRQSDEALAQGLDRDGLVSFIDRWERVPLFASQRFLPAETRAMVREQRLAGSAPGLANSLRGAGAGQPDPLWEHLECLAMPSLVIVGGLDEKYCAIARRMAGMMQRATLAIVPGVGHTVHLEVPQVFEEEVVRFLGGFPSPPAPLPQGARGVQ